MEGKIGQQIFLFPLKLLAVDLFQISLDFVDIRVFGLKILYAVRKYPEYGGASLSCQEQFAQLPKHPYFARQVA